MSFDAAPTTDPTAAPEMAADIVVERSRPASGRAEPDEATLEAAIGIVEALSIAWATMTAFEDPRGLEAFQRAVALLGQAPWYPQRLDVGTDGFLLGDHPVAANRDAARRLARRLFAHGTGAIEIASPPSGDELMAALRVIAESPSGEDPGNALAAMGIRSVLLLHRYLLVADGVEGEDANAVGTWYIEYGGDPSGFVDPLLDEHGDDPAAAAAEFTGEYTRVLDVVAEEDERAHSEVVHAFVDAFSHLPEGHQAAVISTMLHSQTAATEVFLDQLGSQQLGELSASLSPEARPMLVEYARIAAAHGERRHTELLSLLNQRSGGERPLRAAIIDEVDGVLRARSGEVDVAIDRLRRLRRSAAADRTTVLNVTRGLFSVVDDPSFERIADAWAAKVAVSVTDGRLAVSDLWFGAVLGIPLHEHRQSVLLKALGKAFDGDAAEAAAAVVTSEGTGPGAGLRRAAPLFLAGPLIKRVTEAGPEARTGLLAALVAVTRARPSGVVPYLASQHSDHVRVALIALGHSRSAGVVKWITPLLHHREPGVREQALRAVMRLRGAAAAPAVLAALDDRDERVRALAATAVAGSPNPDIDTALLARLDEAEDLPGEIAAISLLARRNTPACRDRLLGLAHRRWAWRRRTRARRNAARSALKGATHE